MTRETEGPQDAEAEATRDEDAKPEPYEPPLAEDIDTGHSPAEAAAQVSPISGVEESTRWH